MNIRLVQVNPRLPFIYDLPAEQRASYGETRSERLLGKKVSDNLHYLFFISCICFALSFSSFVLFLTSPVYALLFSAGFIVFGFSAILTFSLFLYRCIASDYMVMNIYGITNEKISEKSLDAFLERPLIPKFYKKYIVARKTTLEAQLH